MAAEDDQRGPVLLGHGPLERRLERVEVLGGLAEVLDVPAVGGEPRGGVVAERELGGAVDRDVVVVVDAHEAAEPEVAGERGRLVGEPLGQVAVADDAEGAVVDDVGAEARPQLALGERQPTALAMPWPSGPVVTSTPSVWPRSGWPGRLRAPLPEGPEVVEA